jgi:hypothetical protein
LIHPRAEASNKARESLITGKRLDFHNQNEYETTRLFQKAGDEMQRGSNWVLGDLIVNDA